MRSSAAAARTTLVLVALVVSLAIPVPAALAQRVPRIWEVALGIPVDEIPADFVMQACGSNGGPPTTPLNGFKEFARCPVEPATGLHEVWFSYDDTEEYFLRAHRMMEEIIDAGRANTLFGQLVIYSVLIDAEGRIQGYRIISDPREKVVRRWEADVIAMPLQNVVFGAGGWTCTDLPPIEGEKPFRGQLKKENCQKLSDERRITMETRVLLKPGQMLTRQGEALQPNEFDVQVRVEVVKAGLLR